MNCTSATQGTCEDGVCACKEGWTGVTCNVKLCKNNCVDQGFCVDGKCKCFGPVAARRRKLWRYGFEGDDCSQRRCPANCTSAERGSCNGTTGLCQCVDGAVGIDCNRTKCDKPCNGKGVCPDKESGCQCDWGWKGDDCQTPYCVNNCSFILGQGYCVKATQTCQCQAKFTGHDCSQRTCECVCDTSRVSFRLMPFGSRLLVCCSVRCPTSLPPTSDLRFEPVPFPGNSTIDGADADPDPLACSRNGWCVKGKCACFPGRKGEACELKQCPMTKGIECSKHGICNGTTGVCECDPGFDGTACQAAVSAMSNNCPNNCSNRGICKNGTCYCEHGKFFGESCEKVRIACPDGCDRNGKCDPETGKCNCFAGRGGEDCMTQICYPSANCSGRGECRARDGVYGACECAAPFTGEDCNDVQCSDPCSGHGQCLNNECFCEQGYTGDKCQEGMCACVLCSSSCLSLHAMVVRFSRCICRSWCTQSCARATAVVVVPASLTAASATSAMEVAPATCSWSRAPALTSARTSRVTITAPARLLLTRKFRSEYVGILKPYFCLHDSRLRCTTSQTIHIELLPRCLDRWPMVPLASVRATRVGTELTVVRRIVPRAAMKLPNRASVHFPTYVSAARHTGVNNARRNDAPRPATARDLATATPVSAWQDGEARLATSVRAIVLLRCCPYRYTRYARSACFGDDMALVT